MPKDWTAVGPPWEAKPLKERAADCLTFLYLHGLLTDTERTKARGRLRAALVTQQKEDAA